MQPLLFNNIPFEQVAKLDILVDSGSINLEKVGDTWVLANNRQQQFHKQE